MIPDLDASGWLQLVVLIGSWTAVIVALFVCLPRMLLESSDRREQGNYALSITTRFLPLSQSVVASIDAGLDRYEPSKEKRMPALKNDCPTGCGRPVDFGKLMCRSCWSRVPGDLKHAVSRAWAGHRRLMRGERTLDQVRESRETYEAAKEAAIASIA